MFLPLSARLCFIVTQHGGCHIRSSSSTIVLSLGHSCYGKNTMPTTNLSINEDTFTDFFNDS